VTNKIETQTGARNAVPAKFWRCTIFFQNDDKMVFYTLCGAKRSTPAAVPMEIEFAAKE
jgi:hypothetical protein